MSVYVTGPPIPDREALLRRAMETDTVKSIGPWALQNYYAGRRVLAHWMLEHRRPKGPTPPAVQQMLDDPYLWVDPPPSAMPRGRLRDDGLGLIAGSPVGTLWSSWFGMPVSPLVNYLLTRGVSGDQIVGIVPLTRAQRLRGKRRRGLAMVAAFGTLAAFAITFFPHTVYVYNGFPVPIEAVIDGTRYRVGPMANQNVRVWHWKTHFSSESEDHVAIDDRDVTLSFRDVVYVPGSQAVLEVEDIVYGPGNGAEPVILPLAVTQTTSANYVFTSPPGSIRIDTGTSAHRAHLLNVLALPEMRRPGARVAFVADQFGTDAAVAMLKTSLAIAPDQYEMAMQLDGTLGPNRETFWADLHKRAPRSLAIWRRYGEVSVNKAGFLNDARVAANTGGDLAATAGVIVALFCPDPEETLRTADAGLQTTNPSAPDQPGDGTVRAVLLEARADALARLGHWADADTAWAAYLGEPAADPSRGLREQARVRRLGGLPAPGQEPAAEEGEDSRLLRELLDLAAHPTRADAILVAAQSYADPLLARFVLTVAAGRQRDARLRLNDLKGKLADRTYLEDALMIELAEAGNRTGLAVLLGGVDHLSAGWSRVSAVASSVRSLPSAPDWAIEADRDGDGGPTLADIRARASAPPAQDAWRSWAPRHWALADVAAAWVAAGSGDTAARDAWYALAHAAAIPGEILGTPTAVEVDFTADTMEPG